jgi:hypothetical protein
MAVITATALKGTAGSQTVTKTVLGASDTLPYVSGAGQTLVLHNTTGGSLTAKLDGAGSTTVSPEGLGATVDVSGGYDIVVAAGAIKAVKLDSIAAYLAGVVTVTGASGLTAFLTN